MYLVSLIALWVWPFSGLHLRHQSIGATGACYLVPLLYVVLAGLRPEGTHDVFRRVDSTVHLRLSVGEETRCTYPCVDGWTYPTYKWPVKKKKTSPRYHQWSYLRTRFVYVWNDNVSDVISTFVSVVCSLIFTVLLLLSLFPNIIVVCSGFSTTQGLDIVMTHVYTIRSWVLLSLQLLDRRIHDRTNLVKPVGYFFVMS